MDKRRFTQAMDLATAGAALPIHERVAVADANGTRDDGFCRRKGPFLPSTIINNVLMNSNMRDLPKEPVPFSSTDDGFRGADDFADFIFRVKSHCALNRRL